MSAQLVASFASDFAPEQYTDEYQAQLKQLVEAKLERGESVSTAETFGERAEGQGAEVIDLMDALRKSVKGDKSGDKSTPTKKGGRKK